VIRRPAHRFWAVLLGLAVASTGLIASASTQAAAPTQQASEQARAEPRALIRRTEYGTAHIKAPTFRGAGLGIGYAQAQDHFCILAEMWVTIDGRRSLYFGPDESYLSPGNALRFNNLKSDFSYQRLKDLRVVQRGLALPPPHGPSAKVRALAAGYADGYNRYLREVGGADGIGDPACRGAAWVRPITALDVFRRMHAIIGLASFQFMTEALANAKPPLPGAPAETPRVPSPSDLEEALPTTRRLRVGSNGVALGREATRTGSGMLLANPHFAWRGSERFHQFHITIPRRLNVAGASLLGFPLIHIGHTSGVAWTHTTSTAFRFTPYEIKLVPGDPTSYLMDGHVRRMSTQRVTVPVARPDGGTERREHTFYSTEHGPIIEYPAAYLTWGPTTAYALRDANATNFRAADTWVAMGEAQSVAEIRAAEERIQGIPWVNTVAADKHGNAYYADQSVVPAVPDTLAERCVTSPIGQVLYRQARLPVLDGSRSECDWERDADAVDPGTFGPQHLPRLLRGDYVTNHNNSHWLANPEQPLTGFARIIGDERTARSLRTRLGLKMVHGRLDGTDGLGPPGFTLDNVLELTLNNRNHSAELFRDQVVDMCRRQPVMPSSSGPPVNVTDACEVLARWDLRADLDSRGTYLWQEFFNRAAKVPGGPYADQFDPARPIDTPRTLNTVHPAVQRALGDAVLELRKHEIPPDRPWGQVQDRAGIPIHGCDASTGLDRVTGMYDQQGCFNLMISERRPDGTLNPVHATSFGMATTWNGDAPTTRTILAYSQSSDPTRPHVDDQTRLFSQKRWVVERFAEHEITGDPALRVTALCGTRTESASRAQDGGAVQRLTSCPAR
jgi:acyl-homoserine-lactone acylase